MPANLPPQYFDAEKKYRLAKTPQEKIQALEEMLRIMPKHKGTDKLQGDLRRKISKLRNESSKRTTGGRRSDLYLVEKAGIGQIALMGPPNVGKSQLVASMTNARAEVADYPFTTRLPQSGMLHFENVRIQLVDLPPIQEAMTEAWVFAILRNADALWIVVDLSRDDLLDQMEQMLQQLQGANIQPVGRVSEPESPQLLSKKVLLVANKADLEPSAEHLEILEEFYGNRFLILPVSALSREGLQVLSKTTFCLLEKLRVYTKTPGKPPDMADPVVLPRGSTVADFAEQIHKDFAQKLKFARIWGTDKHEGQRVQKDFPLADGDILELHI